VCLTAFLYFAAIACLLIVSLDVTAKSLGQAVLLITDNYDSYWLFVVVKAL